VKKGEHDHWLFIGTIEAMVQKQLQGMPPIQRIALLASELGLKELKLRVAKYLADELDRRHPPERT
jgi:hypothetical protein